MNARVKLRLMRDMIKKHEGWRSKPYEDTEGILTIGYGFNIAQGISREEGDAILDIRLKNVLVSTVSLEEFKHLDDIRQIVIVNMIYNLGLEGVKKFKRMWKAIGNKDYKSAAVEMLDSKWAVQVGRRAEELSDIMRTGEL